MFTNENIDFLNKNFIVYDPYKQLTHKNFHTLQGRQVYFIGELHREQSILTVQNQALKLLAGEVKTLVLLEGSPVDLPTSRPYYSDLPAHIELLGADVRVNWDADTDARWHNLRWTITQFKEKQREEWEIALQEICRGFWSKLDPHYRSINSKHLIISKDHDDEITIISGCLSNTISRKRELKSKLNHIAPTSANSKAKKSFRVELSNEHLAKTIIGKAKNYRRIIVPWGEFHYMCGGKMFSALIAHKISFAILIVKRETKRSIYDLKNHKLCTLTYQTHIYGHKFNTHIKMTPLQKSWFPIEIQKFIKDPVPNSKEINGSDLVHLAKQRNIILPAGRYHFCGVSEDDLLEIVDDSDTPLNILEHTLCNLLAPHGWAVDHLDVKGFDIGCTDSYRPLMISLNLKLDLTITLKRGMVTSLRYLTNYMHTKNLNELILAQNKAMYIRGAPTNVLANLQMFYNWMANQIPPGKILRLSPSYAKWTRITWTSKTTETILTITPHCRPNKITITLFPESIIQPQLPLEK